MNTRTIHCLLLAAVTAVILPACSHEVSHTETDKPGWFGGSTHTEDTTYQNPDGTVSHEHEQSTVKP